MDQEQVAKLTEAEQYHLKAKFILHEVHANKKVYGANSAWMGAKPANVELALQYINRSLEYFPDNPVYLNLKALLLWEGMGNKEAAQPLLERAAQLDPRNIDIQNNLNAMKSSQCVVATAAFGTPLAAEVNVLRRWRDQHLLNSAAGRQFVRSYYRVGPAVANAIVYRPRLRGVARAVLRPIIWALKALGVAA